MAFFVNLVNLVNLVNIFKLFKLFNLFPLSSYLFLRYTVAVRATL